MTVRLQVTRSGFSATLIGVPLFNFLYFGFYYNLKNMVHTKTSIMRDVISSMIAGSICQVITNPIWVVRVRMQSAILHLSPEFDETKYRNVYQSFKTVYKSEGMHGLYKGSIISQVGRHTFTQAQSTQL